MCWDQIVKQPARLASLSLLLALHNSAASLKSAAGSRTPNNVLILHSKPELGLFQEVAVCFCKNDPLFSDALLLLLPQLALLLMLDA